MTRTTSALTRPLIVENPVAVQLLGICSALAVTRTLAIALVLGAALTLTLVGSNVLISLLRKAIPHRTRLVLQITIIASLVIVIDLGLRAFTPDLSRELSIYVSLIITNCIVMGRAEAFAMGQPVGASALDALGNGLGYGGVLAVVGAVRELFGAGSLLGWKVLPLAADGGWFEPLEILQRPPSAFFLLGGLAALSYVARRVKRTRTAAPAAAAERS